MRFPGVKLAADRRKLGLVEQLVPPDELLPVGDADVHPVENSVLIGVAHGNELDVDLGFHEGQVPELVRAGIVPAGAVICRQAAEKRVDAAHRAVPALHTAPYCGHRTINPCPLYPNPKNVAW